MVPMCVNLYGRVCAKREMDPLQLWKGWQNLYNSSVVMTPGICKTLHCFQNITGATWSSFTLISPLLRIVNPLTNRSLDSKHHNKPKWVLSGVIWLQAESSPPFKSLKTPPEPSKAFHLTVTEYDMTSYLLKPQYVTGPTDVTTTHSKVIIKPTDED